MRLQVQRKQNMVDPGVHLLLKNGYRISIQQSDFHMCDENTCEIAIKNKEGKMLEDVTGYVTASALADIIELIENEDMRSLLNWKWEE